MICVLISCYNGEKYLEAQLESLLQQKDVSLKILVRDDGSTDRTQEILDAWQERGLLTWYQGKNIGFAKSFLDLLAHAPVADYYAFCDQDDIWLPEKLANAKAWLELMSQGLNLYCSNLYIYRDGKNEGLWRKKVPKLDLHHSLVENVATGCTVVFTNRLRDIVIKYLPSNVRLHDFWLYQTAMIFGEVCFDEQAYIYYRQHDNNQIGANSRFIDKVKCRMRSLLTIRQQHYRQEEAQNLLRCYSEIMTEAQKGVVSVVANYRESMRYRIRLLFSTKFVMNNSIDTFWLKVRVILGCV